MITGAYFLSRSSMESFTLMSPKLCQGAGALISIHDPDASPSPFAVQWMHRLVISFWDLHVDDAEKGLKAARPTDAKRIVEFVRSIEHEVGIVVVNCEMGISRSSAVAKFIADQYGVICSGNNDGSMFNRRVYELLKTAARQ